jgi:glycosyltransferase involved in cell wall biosynthesis
MPKVSVIVPTYNQAHFLSQAIQSVIAQTEVDWEMVVVNNQSTDGTVQVVQSFGDPRIRLVEIQNGGIIAKSRNLGLAYATSPFVAFLDSDDSWYPQKLSTCLQQIGEADIVCHAELWTRNGRALKKVRYGPERRTRYRSLLYKGNCMSTSAVVARRDLLKSVGGFSEDPTIVTAEDYDLWLSLSKRNARFRFIDTLLGEYRLHDTSASSSTLRHFAAIREVVERHHSALDDGTFRSKLRIRRARARLFYGAARVLQKSGSRGDAWPWIWHAVAADPFQLRIYCTAALSLVPTWRRSRAGIF